MRDGDNSYVDAESLKFLTFRQFIEITVVEVDRNSQNEVLGTVRFDVGKNQNKQILHGRFPRRCRYQVYVDASVQQRTTGSPRR